MGEVKKLYCEICKAEIIPPTYSDPSGSGEIRYHFGLYPMKGDAFKQEDLTAGEMCEICYGKLRTYFRTKMTAAATAWLTEIPAIATWKLPTL